MPQTEKCVVTYDEFSICHTQSSGKKTICYSSSPLCYLVDGEYVPYDMDFELSGTVFKSKSSCSPMAFDGQSLSFAKGASFLLEPSMNKPEVCGSTVSFGSTLLTCFPLGFSIDSSCFLTDGFYESLYTFSLPGGFVYKTGDTCYTLTTANGESFLFSCPFLFNNNGMHCPPMDSHHINLGDSWLLRFQYSADFLSGPCVESAEVRILNRSVSGSFEGKWFELGSSATNTGNTLAVGKTPIMGESGESLEDRAALKLTLSGTDTIESAELRIKRKNGTLSSLCASSVSSPSYESLNGLSSPVTSGIGVSLISSSWFSFDLTENLDSLLGSGGSTLTILLFGTVNNAVANLYSPTSLSGPTITITCNNYGVAAPCGFVQDQSGPGNCAGYALRTFSDAWYLESSMYSFFSNISFGITASDMASYLQFNIAPHYSSLRILSTYNSRIYNHERRVAFRLKLNSHNAYDANSDYHFMRQCNDGSWAQHLGDGGYYILVPGESSVSDPSNWVGYNSAIVIFAISGVYVA